MKPLLCFWLIIFSTSAYGQITFDVNSDHVGFLDNFTFGELSHWTPLNLEFFEGDLGRTGTFSSFQNYSVT